MARTRTATYSPEQTARRAQLKTATIGLVAHLRSYDAKAAMGRLTPDHGTAKVTLPGSRLRCDVDVTLVDGTPRYTFEDPVTREPCTADDVRTVQRALAPAPSPWPRVVVRTLVVGLALAAVAALAIWPLEASTDFVKHHGAVLAVAVVGITAIVVGGLELRRVRRRRRVERDGLVRLGGAAARRR
ncbi:hypothetical protein GCM10025864_12970 [Luteimicrobium album]|uniref:Uncharacterized protein n=1 Tax=Luteimicrobium album TaxID=1054550 RepID=A0ABQ6I036_9MICO|nr:hypothetical protein [Luteimicrobium album]GMA23538.1 hypothetical protein GCM10025864_12970 [Luteimicrobium album]